MEYARIVRKEYYQVRITGFSLGNKTIHESQLPGINAPRLGLYLYHSTDQVELIVILSPQEHYRYGDDSIHICEL